MAYSPTSSASTDATLVADESPINQLSRNELTDAMTVHYDKFTNPSLELTGNPSGDATPQANGHNIASPTPQTPQFDPRALLNPKTSTVKRPASSGGEFDRGRADPTIAGQVSLVERLHNVQERTASPAKRVKTEEERKKATGTSSFGGGSALELQRQSTQSSARPGPAIDLTMSKHIKVQ